MSKEQSFAGPQLRFNGFLVDLRLHGIGNKHHDDVAAARSFGRVDHFQLLGLCLRSRLAGGRQSYDHFLSAVS